MSAFLNDDNQVSLVDPSGMRIGNLAASIVQGTTSASTQEISLSTLTFPTMSNGTRRLVRISTGANDVLFALGPAGAAASFTNASNMTYLPQRWVEYTTIDITIDKSLYILQVTAGGQVQMSVLG